jgi:predicted nucleic acid-binding protein
MSRFCLDTSAYSHFKRGHAPVVEQLDRAEWVGIPAVVVGELWTGFLQGDQIERNEAELQEFVANPYVEVVQIDERVARVYGEIVVDLRKAGRPLPTNDIWIAAASATAGATVLTYDEHFKDMTRIGSLVLSPPVSRSPERQ